MGMENTRWWNLSVIILKMGWGRPPPLPYLTKPTILKWQPILVILRGETNFEICSAVLGQMFLDDWAHKMIFKYIKRCFYNHCSQMAEPIFTCFSNHCILMSFFSLGRLIRYLTGQVFISEFYFEPLLKLFF